MEDTRSEMQELLREINKCSVLALDAFHQSFHFSLMMRYLNLLSAQLFGGGERAVPVKEVEGGQNPRRSWMLWLCQIIIFFSDEIRNEIAEGGIKSSRYCHSSLISSQKTTYGLRPLLLSFIALHRKESEPLYIGVAGYKRKKKNREDWQPAYSRLLSLHA